MTIGASKPLVSCLCVTEDRAAFMPWLFWNYDRQSYARRELVIVDSSTIPFEPLGRSERVPGASARRPVRSSSSGYPTKFRIFQRILGNKAWSRRTSLVPLRLTTVTRTLFGL